MRMRCGREGSQTRRCGTGPVELGARHCLAGAPLSPLHRGTSAGSPRRGLRAELSWPPSEVADPVSGQLEEIQERRGTYVVVPVTVGSRDPKMGSPRNTLLLTRLAHAPGPFGVYLGKVVRPALGATTIPCPGRSPPGTSLLPSSPFGFFLPGFRCGAKLPV